jgi:dihydroxyacetone kinase-like protein
MPSAGKKGRDVKSFTNQEGARIVDDLTVAIRENKQQLSEIDGAIGDGDHGVNMAKGFGFAAEELEKNPGNFSHGLGVIGKTLMMRIGGAMGPLYGNLFRSMSKAIKDRESIDAEAFGEMLKAAGQGIGALSQARVGDKSLVDALYPAVEAYGKARERGKDFEESLEAMVEAARAGRDSTRDLVSKIGRSSRLGERSRGTLDAGAASCCLILETMAAGIKQLIR